MFILKSKVQHPPTVIILPENCMFFLVPDTQFEPVENFQSATVWKKLHLEPPQVLSASPAMLRGVLSAKLQSHLPHNPSFG